MLVQRHVCGIALFVLESLLDKNPLTLTDTLKRAFPFVLLCAYGLFTCGYFFLEDYSGHYRLFARFVFLFGFFVLFSGIRENYRHPLFQVMAIYIFYMLLSGLWATQMDWFRLGQKTTISIYIISFITIMYFLVQWNHVLFERMLQVCILVAAAAAMISIVVFYQDNAFPGTRMEGLGALSNVNEFSNVFGVFGLLALGFALRAPTQGGKLLLLGAVAIFLSYAWFGQSRTAFVSMIIAMVILAGLTRKRKRSLLVAIVAAALFGALMLILFPDTSEQAFLRGMGLRPQIWAGTWSEAVLTPLFGHGLTSDIAVKVGGNVFETSHNAYLQAFWQGGLVGLGLLLLVLLVGFRYALSFGRRQGDYTIFCMLIFVVCTMMTGVDTLIDRPRDKWMLFWFPLGLLLSYEALRPPYGTNRAVTGDERREP